MQPSDAETKRLQAEEAESSRQVSAPDSNQSRQVSQLQYDETFATRRSPRPMSIMRHHVDVGRPPLPDKVDMAMRTSMDMVTLGQSHDHAQWRSIAEEFSALLDVDFVDVVFKVRGGSGFLAAHRTLVAAAWPLLRDELRPFEVRPPRDMRLAGLSWIESKNPDQDAEVRQPSGSPPHTGQNSPQSPRRNVRGSGDETSGAIEQATKRRAPTPEKASVLDMTQRTWGSFSIMRALICHLYNHSVEVAEREIPHLRAAAQAFGCSELVRSCDDVERRPGPMARLAPTKNSGAPDSQEVVASPTLGIAGPPQSLSGMSITTSAPASSDAASLSTDHAGTLHEIPSQILQDPKTAVLSGASDQMSSTEAAGPVRVTSRPPKERPDPRERTFEKSEKTAETGGVRRVLSEIKRNIAESSRIIADKTFQQIYEMVPGERGILGEGINGPVRMARHRKTNREVAVKRIHCVNLSEQRRQMLVSEIRIFLQVSHRNIVQLLEVYESEVDQAVLLVMELCTGRELFERLAERRWYSEFDAARVTRQMLDAVSYLHSQNICHRDLKLENWLYENPSQEAKLKLCDFGFGQIVEPSVQLTVTLGSLFYLAPEVLEGSYGLPCDMWSIGVIVYMLIAGVPPFDGKTDGDVMTKIRQGRFVSTGKRWEGISETAKHFVRSLLRKDPYERLTAAEAAQHAWLKMESQPKAYSWPKGSPDAELELPIDRGVIRDMWKFAQNNAITRAALGLLAKWNTTAPGGKEEDVLVLEQRFKKLDDQNTGKIDAEAFIRVLKETMQISSAEEKQFFERIAGNIPGSAEVSDDQGYRQHRRREVNYSDFIMLTKARRMANNAVAIREAFRAFDEAGDGYIKEDDMHSILGDEFKATIEDYVDINGRELIDYVDFANIVSKEMAKKDEDEMSDKNAAGGLQPAGIERVASHVSSYKSDGGGGPERETVQDIPGESVRTFSELTDADHNAIATSNAEAHTDVNVSDASAAATKAAKKDDEEENKEGEDEEEDYDADAQSVEEQLVNVKNMPTEDAPGRREDTEAGGQQEEKSMEQKKQEQKKHAKSQGYNSSFSLSLAGSSEYDDTPWGVNRVMSMPSDVYSIRQMPGFHSRILRPFYANRPVSNIVMGLIRGTSLYAKQSVAARLATIIHTTWGWFFIMPNPKYHTEVDSRKGLLSKETGKFRFVAWWIHPRFVPQLRQWFERLTYEGDHERQTERREARRQRDAEPDRNEGRREARQRDPTVGPTAEREGASGPGLGVGGGVGSGAALAAAAASGLVAGPRSPRGGVGGGTGAGVQGAGAIAGGAAFGPGNGFPNDASGPGAAGRRSAAGAPRSAAEGVLPKPVGDGPPGLGGFNQDIGSPGDFSFSDVPKPENYLHTYRDLHTKEHVSMLSQAYEGTHRFLRSLFDENFLARANISMGFHYPVRTQYATLHMQVRVNSGSVCREDGRGTEAAQLIENMKRDRCQYERDEQILRYHVTENIKVSLLAAANEYEEQNAGESVFRHTAPLSFELGSQTMPTIQDRDEEGDENDDEEDAESQNYNKASAVDQVAPQLHLSADDDSSEVASYLINLQPSPASAFFKFCYEQRQLCSSAYSPDPSYLYPLHVSVTGFFEAPRNVMVELVQIMMEDIAREIHVNSLIKVGKVVRTKTGYVLFDMSAPAISSFAQKLGEHAQQKLGICVRPKAVNHISLASDRRDEEMREKIAALYEPPSGLQGEEVRAVCESATFDLVLSRLVRRSSFETFATEGPHRFAEVTRLPVRPFISGGSIPRDPQAFDRSPSQQSLGQSAPPPPPSSLQAADGETQPNEESCDPSPNSSRVGE